MIRVDPNRDLPSTTDAGGCVAILDNYDSFTFNLVQAIALLGVACVVFSNDEVTPEELATGGFLGLVLSPGPAEPEQAGVTLQALKALHRKLPILGVCLGHQAIAVAFGGRVIRALEPRHGKRSAIEHDGRDLFAGLPNPVAMARYNSLVVEPETLPPCLEVRARSGTEIMALRHREHPVWGVQFHPESVLSDEGPPLLANWLRSLKPLRPE